MIRESTLDAFLNELASSAPTPGGGSSAALMGAMGAALISMVCNLTLGKEKYAHVQDEARDLLHRSEALRARLTDLVQEDIDAFGRLSQCYKLPKSTPEEKAQRSAALQECLVEACTVPLETAEACSRLIDLCGPAADIGNRQAISDVGVAVYAARAGLESAALNVEINLALIKDHAFVDASGKRMEDLLRDLDGRTALVARAVKAKL